jgi:hypothetical protein
MSEYPTLHEMGISKPETIDRYSLQTVNNMDILRIVYKKHKGSILPDSKRFRFPRTEKMTAGDGGTKEAQFYSEISPVVHKAMAELDQIVKAKRNRSSQIDLIKEEIQRLAEETSHRIAYIESLVAELK